MRVMSSCAFKLTVNFESRPDGGLRAYSDDLPGVVLSSTDVDGVVQDVTEALKVIVSHLLNAEVEVQPLVGFREFSENNGIVSPQPLVPGRREYVAIGR